MRTFLHKLMVDLTRHPREVITPVWSTSLVVNAFRVYEYWFGRRMGVRIEGALDGQGRMISYTWENFLAHQEGRLRALKNPFAFKLVPLPVLVTPDGTQIKQNAIFNYAIAFDNAATGGTGVLSFAYTVTGSNPFLFSSIEGGNGSSTTLTTATYNAVNMTAGVIGVSDNTTLSGLYSAYLIAPATGSHTLTMATSVTGQGMVASSYSGVAQTTPDSNTKQNATAGTSVTLTINTATANCWMMMMTCAPNNTPTAGTGATGRSLNGAGAGLPSAFDSNGVITTGGYSMTANGYATSTAGIAYAFTQVTAAAINSGFFFAAAS